MHDQAVLAEVSRRIVEVADPEKIILFGSTARGDMTPHSDLDLLIIKEGGDALDHMGRIYMGLHGVETAVDALVVAPDDGERYKSSHALVFRPALQEGKVIYENPRTPFSRRSGRVDESRQLDYPGSISCYPDFQRSTSS